MALHVEDQLVAAQFGFGELRLERTPFGKLVEAAVRPRAKASFMARE
jgi:hypothetical protein